MKEKKNRSSKNISKIIKESKKISYYTRCHERSVILMFHKSFKNSFRKETKTVND